MIIGHNTQHLHRSGEEGEPATLGSVAGAWGVMEVGGGEVEKDRLGVLTEGLGEPWRDGGGGLREE